MTDDPLHEFNMKNWPDLRARLLQEWPRSVLVLRWMETRFQWLAQEPENQFHVLCPGGDAENGLVTFGKTGGRVFYLTIFNFNNNEQKLKEALLKTKKIDWSERSICGVPEDLSAWFKQLLEAKQFKIHEIDNTDYYYLPKDISKKITLRIPSDVYLAPLTPEDVQTVNDLWPHRFEGSEIFLKELCRLNYGIGLYSNVNDELLSWGIKYEYADIGALQTKEEHRRKGYASMVIRAMAMTMVCNAELVYAFIVKGNVVSENIFKNMGFRLAGSYDWFSYEC